MSLYFEASAILEEIKDQPSLLKDKVYKSKDLKSSPGAVFAVLSEAIKWSEVLAEVIDKSQILTLEKKLTPTLSLILVHDLLLAKNGLSLSKKHAIYDIITKHKARLTSELTRARIKRGLPSLAALRDQINAVPSSSDPLAFHPRWIRINTLRVSLSSALTTIFKTYTPVSSLATLASTPNGIYTDPHIPSLIALHPSQDLTKSPSYHSGALIFQDKASCFPAYLLDPSGEGRVIDGCAAPGNKTTHLAAIIREKVAGGAVTACERSLPRAETLKTMVKKAGAGEMVQVRAGQDFLALKSESGDWDDVTGILLDPSCSGSGIVGRDEGPRTVVLPRDPRSGTGGPPDVVKDGKGKGKKRKRGSESGVNGQDVNGTARDEARTVHVAEDEEVDALSTQQVEGEKLKERLRALSTFQLKLLVHAFRFPAAERITYSTCSVHAEENENVVVKALASEVARERGWRIMSRQEQVEGLRKWERRGDVTATKVVVSSLSDGASNLDSQEIAEGCIRCAKGTEEGTMGFFVAGFIRGESLAKHNGAATQGTRSERMNSEASESEFEGFD
ncbi:25S rRNA (cytosine-C(5))-methyltransferase rcm1 [Sphaceloma murrayae]|uniref:25S rRNA (Cytosine-C(5))-methyltransferase rcm1 n=1 Tax=Sphaceloma murrayae TaxID=2082308 RepID=A0A2K1QJ63_9PEZI|nr:25S rRNA (cytosine-C(5))-methyltransferase rcm1 [Sphaceloma murrayae]